MYKLDQPLFLLLLLLLIPGIILWRRQSPRGRTFHFIRFRIIFQNLENKNPIPSRPPFYTGYSRVYSDSVQTSLPAGGYPGYQGRNCYGGNTGQKRQYGDMDG